MLVGSVVADFFNEGGDHLSTLHSDSAWINEKADKLSAKGNVKVVSESGYVLISNTILKPESAENLLTVLINSCLTAFCKLISIDK